jgi:hypothetical protein
MACVVTSFSSGNTPEGALIPCGGFAGTVKYSSTNNPREVTLKIQGALSDGWVTNW